MVSPVVVSSLTDPHWTGPLGRLWGSTGGRLEVDFTDATRAEPGCLWFDWSRSVEDPCEYVLVEAFRDDAAGGAHVQSDHFRTARQTLPPHLAQTPRIVNFSVPRENWSELGEMAVVAE